jgi:hypothetical protein
MGATATVMRISLLMALAAQLGFAQATLPTAYTGPWEYTEPPEGWAFSGLGTPDYLPDYDGLNDGAAKLDGTGDYIAIHYDAAAAKVTYWAKGLTFSGGTFRVEQSIDGTNWTELATYTELATNATFHKNKPFMASRYIRFNYTEKVHGNVGVDGISIAALGDFVQPVITDVSTTGSVARVSILKSVVDRIYALDTTTVLTNVPVIWTPIQSEEGTGGILDLQDPAPTNAVRFYRVRDATP